MEQECYEILHADGKVDEDRAERCRQEFFAQDEVMLVVTPTRRPESVKEVAASVSVVTRQELERWSADSPAEMLRKVPGVQITDSGQAGLKRIRIRGEESRRVAILIDGQEFVDQREVGTPLLVAPEMIERVEVVRGTGSVLHGSRAIGGVVNFITKKGGYHPRQGTVSSLYDSATDGYNLYGSFYGSSNGWDYRLGAAQADHDDRKSAEGTLENTAYENESIALYLAKNLGKHTVGASYDDFNASSGVYVEPAVATAPPFNDFRIDAPQRDRSKTSLFYDFRNPSSILRSAHLDAYYQVSEREFNTFSDINLDIGGRSVSSLIDNFSDSTLDTIGSNAQVDLGIDSSHDLIVGVEAKNDALEQTRNRFVTTAAMAAPVEVTFEEADQTTLEMFAEDAWEVVQDFELRFGARAIFIETELEESTREGLDPFSTSDNTVVGAAGVRYLGLSDTTLWAGWSQGYVAPSLINLATGAFAGSSFVNPNPDLDPESSNSFEVGARVVKDAYATDASFFYTEGKDYIDHVLCSESDARCVQPTSSRDRVYDNIDEARTFGAEASVYWYLDPLTPYASGTWLRRRFTRSGDSTYKTGIPDMFGRIGVKAEHRFSDPIMLWGDVYAFASTDAEELDGNDVLRTAGWGTLNFAFGTVMGDKNELKMSVELLNLGDKFYRTSTENLPARGMSAIVKVGLDL